jgi:hypothetical protein
MGATSGVRSRSYARLDEVPDVTRQGARAEEHRLSIVPEIEAYATGGNRIHLDRIDNLGKVREPIRVEYKVRKVDRPPESWALVAGD